MSLNNLSPIGWHRNPRHLLQQRSYFNNTKYVQPVPTGTVLPFQLFRAKGQAGALTSFIIYRERDGAAFDVLSTVNNTGLSIEMQENVDLISYLSTSSLTGSFEAGYHYAVMQDGVNVWTSDYFLWVDDQNGLIKIEYSHPEDITVDLPHLRTWGTLNNAQPWTFRVYLKTDIAKPTYQFNREVDTRNTVEYPYRRTRYKQYEFTAILSEYLADALSLIPIHANVRITHLGEIIYCDDFRMSEPRWISGRGDMAEFDFTFRSGTLATTYATPGSSTVTDSPTRSCVSTDYFVERYILDTSNAYASLDDVARVVQSTPSFVLYGTTAAGVALYKVEDNGDNPVIFPVTQVTNMSVFVQLSNTYYIYNGGQYVLPRIETIGSAPDYTLTATVMGLTSSRIQYRTAGGEYTDLPGTYTQAQLLAGVDLGIAAENYEEVRVVISTNICGDVFITAPVFVTPPPVTVLTGIGYDEIGGYTIA
jgi:hypothetical protein